MSRLYYSDGESVRYSTGGEVPTSSLERDLGESPISAAATELNRLQTIINIMERKLDNPAPDEDLHTRDGVAEYILSNGGWVCSKQTDVLYHIEGVSNVGVKVRSLWYGFEEFYRLYNYHPMEK